MPLVPTLLEFDEAFDCKRVVAPVEASPVLLGLLAEAGRVLAAGVGLVGLMDVEVMVDRDVPRVIEIDARLPSQTPTAVFHSTGLNMVAEMAGVFTRRHAVGGTAGGCQATNNLSRVDGGFPALNAEGTKGVCYQHVRAWNGYLGVLGEHVMSDAGPLQILRGAGGAHEILTDRRSGVCEWSATLVCLGADAPEARRRADEATARLAREAGLRLAPEA
jgi:pyrrolysine biosynthesis protein PylC